MARRKDKRRVSREQLATNVRKHFNGAAVNEIDVVVELVYKSRNKGKNISFSQVIPLNTPLMSNRQGVPHALSTRNLQKDMIQACMQASKHDDPQIYSFYTLFAHFGHDIDDNSLAAYLSVQHLDIPTRT